MTLFDQQYAFRTELMRRVKRDLIGPENASEIETIADPPLTRYLMGMLYPTTAEPPVEDDRDNEAGGAAGDEDEEPDPPVAMANVRYPSSMGMTFAVDTRTCSEIVIYTEAAQYEEQVLAARSEEWVRHLFSFPILLKCQRQGTSRDHNGVELLQTVSESTPLRSNVVHERQRSPAGRQRTSG